MKENISPQNNGFLLGQSLAEDTFLQAWKNNSIHHAWILSGTPGIGKATLAYRIARFLLAADENKKDSYNSMAISEDNAVFKQVAAGSHPDLMVLERDFIDTDRRKIIAAIRKGEIIDEDEMASFKKSAFIRVEDVRKVGDFLAKTSFNNGWRIVIIDSADDMNNSAANALLKILEEPPAKTILLLISHNPGMLLATIRSRCAKLNLKNLEYSEVAALLRRYRSSLNENMIDRLAELSGGSIGKAILYADNDAVILNNKLEEILYSGNNFSLSGLDQFCSTVSADIDKFNLLPELIGRFIRNNIGQKDNTEALYRCWQNAQKMFADCANINMDKKLTLLNILTDICKVI